MPSHHRWLAARLYAAGSIARGRPRLAFSVRPFDETGDTLIEVLISALVIVLVVVATITGLNSANHSTALSRERSQADALAQQDEDQLRSEPINKLSELSLHHETLLREVTTGGTHYTITSTATYKSNNGTTSCTSSSATANYIETSSEVTWKSQGSSNPVIETSIISPPADSALIVQVTGAAGEPVPHMSVQTTGPTSATAETSANGCAILAVSPGEYTINVSRTGYVDNHGYSNSILDPSFSSGFYVVAEQTAKKSYEFAPAGELEVSFSASDGSGAKPEGDSFVAYNSQLTTFKTFGTVGTYANAVKSGATLFPFVSSKYTVYAGTCEADLPTNNGQPSNPEVEVAAGAVTPVHVLLAPINLIVYEGTSSEPKSAVTKELTGTIEDTGCKTLRSFTATAKGALPRPYMPFGSYSLCATAPVAGISRKTTVPISNNVAAGTTARVYLGEGTTGSTCP